MERHIDYLSFQAGGKMTVPFEAFLIFSTNLRPISWATKLSCAVSSTKCSCVAPEGPSSSKSSSVLRSPPASS